MIAVLACFTVIFHMCVLYLLIIIENVVFPIEYQNLIGNC